ncbi:hypothetical protein Ancab_019039 [Ancistrocladus abbreviatus]
MNFDLQLRLLPSPFPSLSSSEFTFMEPNYDVSQQQHQQQRMTIFYNGNIYIWNVTELQARALMSLAKGEVEESTRSNSSHSNLQQTSLLNGGAPGPVAAPAMRRSLQQFLQKRNQRIQTAASPYYHAL